MRKDQASIKRDLVSHYNEGRRYHEANYFDRTDYAPLRYRQHYIEAMIDGLQLPGAARILDVGCGPAELILNLLRRGYDVWGIDIAPGMVEEAQLTLEQAGLGAGDRVAVGDIERLEFPDDFFDVVVAAGVIEYQATDDPSLTEMNRVLKPGGHMILNVTNRYAYTRVFDGMYRRLKTQRGTERTLDAVKRFLGRGPLGEPPPDRRTHSPWAFDRRLSAFGFAKVRHNYFHFSPIPTPFGNQLTILVQLGRRMEALSQGPLGVLGGGYLVMAKKMRPVGRPSKDAQDH